MWSRQPGVGDKHPGFYANAYLQRHGMATAEVQHHEAHVWAGMIDSGLQPPFLGIVWDGAGYGLDGTVWGGEAFVVDGNGMRRVASLYPFRLPGGEKAVREPRRSALGVLNAAHEKICREWIDEAFDLQEAACPVGCFGKRH